MLPNNFSQGKHVQGEIGLVEIENIWNHEKPFYMKRKHHEHEQTWWDGQKC